MKRSILILFIMLLAYHISLTIYADDSPSPDETSPDYSWYGDGSSTTYYLDDINDLIGLSNIVNSTAKSIPKFSLDKKNYDLTEIPNSKEHGEYTVYYMIKNKLATFY